MWLVIDEMSAARDRVNDDYRTQAIITRSATAQGKKAPSLFKKLLESFR